MAGVTSLNLVRDELFATMAEAEQYLEQFIAERQNGGLLQQAVGSLQQVRGTLKLIELAGAELLAQEILRLGMDIPVDAGPERDAQLTALSGALHVLRSYLEGLDVHRQEIPELLLPAINDLRHSVGQPPLPASFFFTVRLDQARPPAELPVVAPDVRQAQARLLRHMYQLGLIGFLRDDNHLPGLKLMARALARFDTLFGHEPRGRLCWVGAGAAEAMLDGQLRPRQSTRKLFSRIDRELKLLLGNEGYEVPRHVLKEMLYLIALADSSGPRASQLRQVFNLSPLPFTDHMLEEGYQRLAGPGQAVMRSLSAAIREELGTVQDLLDLVGRGTAQADSLATLHGLLAKLAKTLGMVGLSSAANALQEQLPQVVGWSAEQPPAAGALERLAEALLYVESMVASLGSARRAAPAPVEKNVSFMLHQLNEARVVVSDEAQAGLAMAKRAIVAYLESDGDKPHLSNVPLSLDAVRGGLWFLGYERAARLVGSCGEFIQRRMLESERMPAEQLLETLADALASIEYFLEDGGRLHGEPREDVLDLAERSVQALGLPVAC